MPRKNYFYPRSPCGERLACNIVLPNVLLFLSTLSLRRATVHAVRRFDGLPISIHALLAESDTSTELSRSSVGLFLSTLSLRRATFFSGRSCFSGIFLSTLSLRRATAANFSSGKSITISIHALLAESDKIQIYRRFRIDAFLSTLSLRRATDYLLKQQQPLPISIHALLAESDRQCGRSNMDLRISIHALLAESDQSVCLMISCIIGFLSTLSLRRATIHLRKVAPRADYFYPRSPCGERRRARRIANHNCRFLSTLSLRRATGLSIFND